MYFLVFKDLGEEGQGGERLLLISKISYYVLCSSKDQKRLTRFSDDGAKMFLPSFFFFFKNLSKTAKRTRNRNTSPVFFEGRRHHGLEPQRRKMRNRWREGEALSGSTESQPQKPQGDVLAHLASSLSEHSTVPGVGRPTCCCGPERARSCQQPRGKKVISNTSYIYEAHARAWPFTNTLPCNPPTMARDGMGTWVAPSLGCPTS